MAENTGELVRTGIAGLDPILLGGIPRGNIILVEGTVGTGKSLFGTEFIYRGITDFNEPGIIVVFETSPNKLMRDATAFGWDLEQLQQQNRLKIIFTRPQVLEQELRSPDSLLLQTATEMGAKRIFIDGISLLRSAPNGNGGIYSTLNAPVSYRELLQQLIEGLNHENLTAILSHECGAMRESMSTLEIAEFLADTVLHIRRIPDENSIRRTIEIVKSRGQDFDSGQHSLRIRNGKGIEVFRRVQAPPREQGAQPSSETMQSMIGVEALDALIGGGILEGSTTMVVGVSGAGKTNLGIQLLLEGANRGERCLLVSLDEHPAQIIRNAARLGLVLQREIDRGSIVLHYQCPQELEIDAHFADIVRLITEHDIKRLLIDGMTTYSTALGSQRVYRDFFHAVVNYTKTRLMLTFFNYETPELFGLTTYMPDFAVSSVVDNIIVLSLIELGNSLHRGVTVAKARGSHHEFATHEFTIGQGGIKLLPADASRAVPALPFPSYSGLLSRAPTRLSPYHREPDRIVTTD